MAGSATFPDFCMSNYYFARNIMKKQCLFTINYSIGAGKRQDIPDKREDRTITGDIMG